MRWAIAAFLVVAGCALASLSGRWVLALPAPSLFAYVAAAGVLALVPLLGILCGYGRRLWLWGLTACLVWLVPLVTWSASDTNTVRRLVHDGRLWPLGPPDPRLVRVSRRPSPSAPSPVSVVIDAGIAADASPQDTGHPPQDTGPATDEVEVFEDSQGVLTIRVVGQPEPPAPDREAQQSSVVKSWPLAAVPHPIAEEARRQFGEISHLKAARYIARNVTQPADRIRAIHDFVARHLRYDVDAWKSHTIGPQDAETVFKTRKAVCAGYAQLVHRMAQEAGLKTEVVVGHALLFDEPEPQGHAWNAVQLDGQWALLDATWNSGFIKDDKLVPRYDTAYLFTPAAIMLETHTPNVARHRLLPKSHPEPAVDRPYRHPRFHAFGLKTDVRRTMNAKGGRLDFKISNPKETNMQASLQNGQQQLPCSRVDEIFSCSVPPGQHTVTVYAGPDATLHAVLRFKVQAVP